LGEEVIPVLRKEFDALRPAHVPDGPTHAARVAQQVETGDLESRDPAQLDAGLEVTSR
jgi:hypothetical protein